MARVTKKNEKKCTFQPDRNKSLFYEPLFNCRNRKSLFPKETYFFDSADCFFSWKAPGQLFFFLFKGKHSFFGVEFEGTVAHSGDADELSN